MSGVSVIVGKDFCRHRSVYTYGVLTPYLPFIHGVSRLFTPLHNLESLTVLDRLTVINY